MSNTESRRRLEEAIRLLTERPEEGRRRLEKLFAELRDERSVLSGKLESAQREVEAETRKVASLKGELQDANTTNAHLRQQLMEEREKAKNSTLPPQRSVHLDRPRQDPPDPGPAVDTIKILISPRAEALVPSLRPSNFESLFGSWASRDELLRECNRLKKSGHDTLSRIIWVGGKRLFFLAVVPSDGTEALLHFFTDGDIPDLDDFTRKDLDDHLTGGRSEHS
jgi:chromosome segregation ATPase